MQRVMPLHRPVPCVGSCSSQMTWLLCLNLRASTLVAFVVVSVGVLLTQASHFWCWRRGLPYAGSVLPCATRVGRRYAPIMWLSSTETSTKTVSSVHSATRWDIVRVPPTSYPGCSSPQHSLGMRLPTLQPLTQVVRLLNTAWV